MRAGFALILAAVFSMLQACASKEDISVSSAKALDFTGSYSGSESGFENNVPFSQTLLLDLTQTGTEVTGTWSNYDNTAFGTVTGKTDGTFTLDEASGSSCYPASYSGTATLSGDTIAMEFAGASSCGPLSAHATEEKSSSVGAVSGTGNTSFQLQAGYYSVSGTITSSGQNGNAVLAITGTLASAPADELYVRIDSVGDELSFDQGGSGFLYITQDMVNLVRQAGCTTIAQVQVANFAVVAPYSAGSYGQSNVDGSFYIVTPCGLQAI